MKKAFKKENIMPVVVLGVICIIVAALLGLINSFTSKEIANQRLEAANEGSLEVLAGLDPSSKEDIPVEEGKYPSSVKSITKYDKGYVIETEVSGNASGMLVLCGVDNDGKITGVKVLSNGETPSYWDKVHPEVTGESGKYNGKSSSDLKAEIISGSTNSSRGVYKAVKASVDTFSVLSGGSFEEEKEVTIDALKTDSEVIALAKEMVPESAGFERVDGVVETSNVVRVYKETSGKGFVAYTVVMSTNYPGYFESETLIYVDNSGTVKDVKKLICKISESNPEWGYTAPSEEEVNALYTRLPGTTCATIGGVELVTNATTTTKRLVGVLKEALLAVYSVNGADLPRSEDEIKTLASDMMGGADFTDITPENNGYIKRLYKETSGKGFVAYLVALSPNYGTVETETLVYIGKDGRIKDVNKLLWKTSDALWGYQPPKEEDVNAFYNKLLGSDLNKFNEKYLGEEPELVSNATSTSTRLVNNIAAALEAVEPYAVNYPRIIGISIASVMVLAIAAFIIVPKIIRRRKNG